MPDRATSITLRTLSFSFFATGTASLSVIGALQEIASALAISRGAVAMLAAVFAITFAVSAPLIQVFAGHLPRRTLLLAGLATVALGAAGCALAPNYAVLIAARIVTGLGMAAVTPVGSSLASTMVPPERQGQALAIVFTGMTVASVVGVPLSSWIAHALGWRWMFGLIALLSVLSGVLLAALLKDRSPGRQVRLRDLLAVLRRRDLSSALAVMVLGLGGLFTSYTMITPILHDKFGAGPHMVSVALLVYGLAGIAGNQVARRLAMLWSAERSLTMSLLMMSVAFVVLAVTPGWLAVALATLVLWALAVDIFLPAQQRRMVELAPEWRGLVLALNSSCLFIGMALGSSSAGKIAPRWGLDSLPLVSIGLILLAFAALGWSRSARSARLAACA
ncbi:MFS transporter [Janthinobacterium agaricidamnosum]|uniref:Major Facilitator Superfamily protein n=1 Tax=Janthinobacterium agaricidamnosum NBRC 102515 = DSM 9628 TaxID=1349767 RepID=W0VAA4_9BURK|nr:MFS transporter [Janthinobacterium agaricidamnosum]CDG84288.1 major Facilitator Superfamily protein [Janthinobacterium agaricidamnosum NBRC 102515 = DSM 9628]